MLLSLDQGLFDVDMVGASFIDILVNKKFDLTYTCLECGFIGSYQRWITNELNNGFVSNIQGGKQSSK